ncbi:hypothetical protein DO71_5714 [Burkholderia pseudomallei]|nr:hypothetical protein DO71_5714 [Burkholderia pseudomallei]
MSMRSSSASRSSAIPSFVDRSRAHRSAAQRQIERLQDVARRGILDKRRDPIPCGVRRAQVRGQRQRAPHVERRVRVGRRGEWPDPLTHDALVPQRRASVLARAHLRFDAVLVQREIGVERARRADARRHGQRDVERARAPLGGQRDADARGLGRRRDDAPPERVRIAPVAQLAAVNRDLRRIDETAAAARGKRVLPLGEAMLREAIRPAEAVPVIDVQRERHDAQRGAARGEPCEPVVGGRATAAALARIELDERLPAVGAAGHARAVRGRLRGARRGKRERRRDGAERNGK